MTKYVFILFLSLLSMSISAQKTEDITEKPVDYSENVATVNSIIETFYHEISGNEEKRNWDLFHFLFHSDAKLITAGKNDERQFQVAFMSAGDYVKKSKKWMDSNCFVEIEISRRTEIFGKMAHVFSTFETFTSESDEDPDMRGINSFQLLNDGERWWIINLYWTNETWLQPIPEKYLD